MRELFARCPQWHAQGDSPAFGHRGKGDGEILHTCLEKCFLYEAGDEMTQAVTYQRVDYVVLLCFHPSPRGTAGN